MAKKISLRHGAGGSPGLNAKIERRIREDEWILRLVPEENCFLLYLTAHDSPPQEDITETLDALQGSLHAEKLRTRLYWVGWRSLYETAEAALNDSAGNPENLQRTILLDLLRLLDLRQLRPFKGWKQVNLSVPLPHDGAFFWQSRWFKDLPLLKIEISRVPHFWREASVR